MLWKEVVVRGAGHMKLVKPAREGHKKDKILGYNTVWEMSQDFKEKSRQDTRQPRR